MSATDWALAAVAAGEFVLIVVLSLVLIGSRRLVRQLRARLAELRGGGTLAVAGRAVKAVIDSAARMRDQGMGGFLTGSVEQLSQWAREDRTAIARVAADDGTVAILFSDIEDSTALNEELGDARWVRLIEAHAAVVQRHVAAHHGHVVKSQGDGFMVVFGEASDAVGAAVAIQAGMRDSSSRQLRRTPVRIRIGAHVGEAIARDGDWFGRNVAFAARVAAQAAGGEILVSAAVSERLSDEFVLEPWGAVELKGISGGEQELYAVAWA